MNLGRFFIDRPVFAIALSIAMLIVGVVAASRLPISQYPECHSACNIDPVSRGIGVQN